MNLSTNTWLMLALVLSIIGNVYQEHTRNSYALLANKQTHLADSLIATYQGTAKLHGQNAQAHQDSASYWEKKYLSLDSTQRVTNSSYDTSDAAYRKSYNRNPSAARLRFLTKRFPDVYSQ